MLLAGLLVLVGSSTLAAPPTYPYEPGDPPPVPIPEPVPTVAEFAGAFQPRAGTHEVVLLHPLTGCPVKVCFTLPPGCPRKVIVRPRAMVFEYARCDVTIRFVRDGSVRVRD
jgi:hypothetical protein